MATKSDNKNTLFIILAIFAVLLIANANADITGNFINWGKWIPKLPSAPASPTGPVTSPTAPAAPSTPAAPTAPSVPPSGPTGPSGPAPPSYTPTAPSPPGTTGNLPPVIQPPTVTPPAVSKVCGQYCRGGNASTSTPPVNCPSGFTCNNNVCTSIYCLEGSSLNNCNDGIDNDGDGAKDCYDSSCGSANNCQENSANNNCWDAFDNDQDGKNDCLDSGCFGVCPWEAGSGSWVGTVAPHDWIACNDNADNDGDGLIDSADPDCFNINIESETNGGIGNQLFQCVNKIDDDSNGVIDAADLKCSFWTKENNGIGCFDRIDNDGNGAVDCADPICINTPYCGENGFSCIDRIDNDGNGAVDCADQGCMLAGFCGPTETGLCVDTLDNDNDGALDCADTDCANDQFCVCQETDAGNDPLNFGSVTIGGAHPVDPFDYCVSGVATFPQPWYSLQPHQFIREADCGSRFTWVGGGGGRSMYEQAPAPSIIDCKTVPGATQGICVNGRCI